MWRNYEVSRASTTRSSCPRPALGLRAVLGFEGSLPLFIHTSKLLGQALGATPQGGSEREVAAGVCSSPLCDV